MHEAAGAPPQLTDGACEAAQSTGALFTWVRASQLPGPGCGFAKRKKARTGSASCRPAGFGIDSASRRPAPACPHRRSRRRSVPAPCACPPEGSTRAAERRAQLGHSLSFLCWSPQSAFCGGEARARFGRAARREAWLRLRSRPPPPSGRAGEAPPAVRRRRRLRLGMPYTQRVYMLRTEEFGVGEWDARCTRLPI